MSGTDCCEVCRVYCFHQGASFLVVDPEQCTDCDLCVPECPVDAIYPEQQLPPDQRRFVGLNAELARLWPVIDTKKAPPPVADDWKWAPDNLHCLERWAALCRGTDATGGATPPPWVNRMKSVGNLRRNFLGRVHLGLHWRCDPADALYRDLIG